MPKDKISAVLHSISFCVIIIGKAMQEITMNIITATIMKNEWNPTGMLYMHR
jgi:hypothetical protein